jgi:hypothetical protein
MNVTRNHKSWTRPAAALAAALGLTLTMASPASAVAGDATSAFGLSATGPVIVNPTAPSAFNSGLSSNNVGSVNVVGLVVTSALDTTATADGATAEVDNTNVTLSPTNTLTASAISSNCLFDVIDGTVSGDSSIASGTISVLGAGPITLEANAAPNTAVVDPALEGIATIILNRQTVGAGGTITVDAVYITLLGATPSLNQTITIASSTCTPGTIVGASMMPISSAVGASVLGLSGLVFYVMRRRQTQHSLIEG